MTFSYECLKKCFIHKHTDVNTKTLKEKLGTLLRSGWLYQWLYDLCWWLLLLHRNLEMKLYDNQNLNKSDGVSTCHAKTNNTEIAKKVHMKTWKTEFEDGRNFKEISTKISHLTSPVKKLFLLIHTYTVTYNGHNKHRIRRNDEKNPTYNVKLWWFRYQVIRDQKRLSESTA